MSAPTDPRPPEGRGAPRGDPALGRLRRSVRARRRRRAEARRHGAPRAWFGLGLFGVIGWSIAVPTLAGAALGAWLDRRHRSRRSWTLSLMLGGLVLGCAQAWTWLRKEVERD